MPPRKRRDTTRPGRHDPAGVSCTPRGRTQTSAACPSGKPGAGKSPSGVATMPPWTTPSISLKSLKKRAANRSTGRR